MWTTNDEKHEQEIATHTSHSFKDAIQFQPGQWVGAPHTQDGRGEIEPDFPLVLPEDANKGSPDLGLTTETRRSARELPCG